MDTKQQITDAQIEQLRTEAGEDGDMCMVETCDRALGFRSPTQEQMDDAVAVCARAIAMQRRNHERAEHDDAIDFLKQAIEAADQAEACLPRGSTQRGEISNALKYLNAALSDCEMQKREWSEVAE